MQHLRINPGHARWRPDSINLFIFDELQAKIQAAANGKHDINTRI